MVFSWTGENLSLNIKGWRFCFETARDGLSLRMGRELKPLPLFLQESMKGKKRAAIVLSSRNIRNAGTKLKPISGTEFLVEGISYIRLG